MRGFNRYQIIIFWLLDEESGPLEMSCNRCCKLMIAHTKLQPVCYFFF